MRDARVVATGGEAAFPAPAKATHLKTPSKEGKSAAERPLLGHRLDGLPRAELDLQLNPVRQIFRKIKRLKVKLAAIDEEGGRAQPYRCSSSS